MKLKLLFALIFLLFTLGGGVAVYSTTWYDLWCILPICLGFFLLERARKHAKKSSSDFGS